MEEKETSATKTTPPKLPRLFNQASKYIQFERHNGVDIREQSRRNYKALLQRLKNRALIPETERHHYGEKRFSADEAQFFLFWLTTISPLFTARHGTEQFAYIQHAGFMMPVADRRRANLVHQNSRTGGTVRQNQNYYVLSIGAKHPVPTSVSNSKIITLHFDKMRPEEKQQYAGMFISGHDADYERDITYPIIVCGTTEYKVSYDKKAQLRTTTFKRADGTLITETLTPAEEIVAADPSIDVIFEWLGYKMIEYLRFIGGDFQTEILRCHDVNKITIVFQALFPSYRFPELKIPLKKIPINADYVEISESNDVSYKEVNAFQQACLRFDFRKVTAMINPTIVSAPGKDDDTSLTILMKERGQYSPELVQLLLDNNADPNAGTFLDSNLTRSFKMGDPNLTSLFMRGSSHPHCPNLRILPRVGYVELNAIIELHQLALFEEFYPHYLKYDNPQKLLSIACTRTQETAQEFPNNAELTESSQRDYQQSLQILERILVDVEPNCDDEAEKVFCEAAKDGKLRVVRAFLKHPKLNINQATGLTGHKKSDYEGWTALHYACWKAQVEVVTTLLDAGIAVNAKTHSGMTALAIAEKVLDDQLDFMSQSERFSEQLTNQNLSLVFKSNIGNRQLSPDAQQNLKAIIAVLKAKNATRDIEAETAETPKATHFAVAACITATFNNGQYVLLARKKNTFDEARGMYLFPGGFYDSHRDQGNFAAGAVREVREETGVDLSGATCKPLATYKNQANNTEYEHQFFLFDLGNVKRLPFCVAKSDIGDAQWVNIEQIESALHNDELALSFRGIPICHSNAIILSALKFQQFPNEQAIISAQKLSIEYSPVNIGSALFLVFHLQGAYELRERLIDTFAELLPKIPSGFLLRCFNELLQILREDQGEEKAKLCVQNFITHLVKTGLCNIDELRQKGMPLLHLSCVSHKTAAILWLLEQGADVNAIFTDYINKIFPLSALFMANDLNSARILIERFGASITLGLTTDSALAVACGQDTIPDEFIEYLIEKAGVITDELFGTVVHELIRTRRLTLLDKMLTRFPIDLNREYFRRQMMLSKFYPILTGINICSLECVKILAKHGADLTLQHQPGSNLIEFAESMERTFKSQRLQSIAHLPEHPKNLAEPGYYHAMKSSLFLEEDLSAEQWEQKLLQSEKDLEEMNKIIEHLKSFLPPKPKAPETLEELTEHMKSQWYQ